MIERGSNLTRLAIIDPGLLEPAGHHAGFAATISSSYHRYRPSFDVVYFASQRLDDAIASRLGAAGITVERFFTSVFYRHFEEAGNAVSRSQYIIQLGLEYFNVFKYLDKLWHGEKVVLLYHTLSWEHATALHLAIQLYGHDGLMFEHHVLLMFSPGLDENGDVYNLQRSLNFRGAFRYLDLNENVFLSASCEEYSVAYMALLNGKCQLPVHPCFLADWEILPKNKQLVPQAETSHLRLVSIRVLFYFGDAKADKGFFRLPEIISQWQPILDENSVLLIQFTACWPDERILGTTETLRAMAEVDSRIQIKESFLPAYKLHVFFQSVDVSVLFYDESRYHHKTSGILWLLGFYQIPVVIYGAGWLARECERLLPIYLILTDRGGANVCERVLAFNQNDKFTINASYRKRIYSSFWSWLASVGHSYE